MYLPPLQPNRNPNIYISGDVTIDERAAIAPGVILLACPGSRIAIAAGVCIGMGSILQVDRGELAIEEGATIGAGVLAIGSGKIGANACIGSATTILNRSIAAGEVVPPGSVLGDESRQWADIEALESSNSPQEESAFIPNFNPPEVPFPTPTPAASPPLEEPAIAPSPTAAANGTAPPATPEPPPEEESAASSPTPVYGHEQIQRLMQTLFPHKQMPNQPTAEE